MAHAAVPPHDHHPSSLPSRGIRDAPPSRRLGPTRYMVHKAMQEKIAAITRAEGEAEAARIISTALTKSGAGLVEVRGGALAPLPPPPLPPLGLGLEPSFSFDRVVFACGAMLEACVARSARCARRVMRRCDWWGSRAA